MSSLWSRVVAKLEVDQNQTGTKAPKDDGNRPTPPEACNWGILDYCAVLPWGAFSIVQWTVGSMLLSLGLTVPQALGAGVVASVMTTAGAIAAGHVGIKYRLSDPLSSRLVWGVRGYAITIIIQIAATTCFYGIQLVYGYLCVKVVIGAMIPSFITMRNTFGDPLPTSHFICMVIFLLVSAVLQAFGLGAWRYIGRVGSVLTLITFVTIVAVTCGEAGGVGPLLQDPFELVGFGQRPTRSEVVWGFFLALSSLMANTSLITEMNYTRFSKNMTAPVPGQVLSRMILPLLVTAFGILATSAAVEVFPNERRLLWAPYELLLAYQMRGGAGARAATFFGGLVLLIPQLRINIASNAYTTGVGYSTLFPRWLNVRRGGYVTLVLGVAINPWRFATRPTDFNRFLQGKAMWYGCLCGMFFVDYFIVRKAIVKVSNLTVRDRSSIYWYKNGFNWRAILTTLLTIPISFPGWVMVMKKGSNKLNNPWEKIYGLSWMLSLVLSGITYYAFSRIWSPPGLLEEDTQEKSMSESSNEQTLSTA